MARLPDISKLSPKELEALIDRASQQKTETKRKTIETLRGEWKKQAEAEGLTIDDVLGRSASTVGKGSVTEGECPICKFETSPPHDGRKHRFQGDDKKPLTAAELREFGLQKV